MTIPEKEHKLTIREKIGYGLGEAGSQFSWTLVSSYLTVYYTDVVGLTPAIISTIMLVARIWDAINDPMFGSLAENTHTRWGRYRPYILFGAPFLALFNCLTFINLDAPLLWKSVWCAITYIGCGMAYTAVNISVGCLANSMTADNRERVSLSAFRGIFSGFVGMLISAITMPMILHFGGGSTSSGRGYFLSAVVYSIACLPCFIACFANTREVIGPAREQRRENVVKAQFRSFAYVFRDRNASLLIIAMFLFLTGIFGRLGIMAYYFIYVLENSALLAGFATAMSAGMLCVNFYAPYMLNHMDKKWVGVISALLQAACCVGFFFAGEARLNVPVVALGFVYGATNMAALVSYSLGAEIVDDNWLRNGVRSDGVIYSCISFSTKMGNAVGGSVGILALGAVGFAANTQMAPAVLTKMDAVINFGPAALFVLAAVFFALNGMTNEKARENEQLVREKYGTGLQS